MFASRRLAELPKPFFPALDARIAELQAAGHRVVDLGRSAPDQPPPEAAVAALGRAVAWPAAHRGAAPAGVPEFRAAVARWYAERHGVRLDPDAEVLPLLGAREGLFLISFAACDPGDVALVPDPSFPAYRLGAYFAGAEVVSLPLRPELGHLPDLGAVPEGVARRARVLFLNYPNNPTGAIAPLGLYRDAVAFARRHGLLLCHDFAYGESGYDGYRAPSILAVEGAHETAIEILSFSAAFCLPGWRCGAAVGNAAAVAALLRIAAQVHRGGLAAVQVAGAAVLDQLRRSGFLVAQNETYRARRDVLCGALAEVGIPVRRPRATPYIWIPCAGARDSAAYALWLLENAGIAVAPGSAFGAGGEGFLRISLTAPAAEVEEAAARLRRLGPDGLRPAERLSRPLPEAEPAGRLAARRVPAPRDAAAPADPDALLGCL